LKFATGTDNLLADTLSRQPLEVCAAETARETDWYQSRIKAVKAEPEQYPDHRFENGRLYRHVLHTLDFNDTAEEQQ